ncbi:MAG TPA: AMP-binding protein [Gammaproteobacteria bacterium]|nr:AMP-binding protein [Gammaproteobacteria bacterium]
MSKPSAPPLTKKVGNRAPAEGVAGAATHLSPHPPVDIPSTPLADFVLTGAAARGGDRPALVDAVTGRAISYAALPELVERTAAGLARLGIGKGDVCAIFAPNTPEYLIAVLAIARLGAVVTTVSSLSTKEDLAKQLRDSAARILFTSAALAAAWTAAIEGTAVERVVVFDDLETGAVGTGVRAAAALGAFGSGGARGNRRSALAFAVLAAGRGGAPEVVIEPSDLVAMPYSSGTTGLPKGVMLTHRNLVANVLQADGASHYIHAEDTTIVFLPLFHIYGLTAIALLGLWSGATMIVMPKFELEPYLDLVARHRASLLHVVPPLVVALAKHPAIDGHDFSSIRKLFSGAAPLGANVIEQCMQRIGCVLQQGYGLTETSPATHITSDDPARIKHGSVGPPVPSTECRVVDPETGRDVAPGEDGEIWVRGPQVMRGYFNRPEETRAAIDDAGWFRTGDIGHADEDGHFFIVDRLKELIKYKGMQVPPAELEAVLLSHPAVADAAVVPLKDEDAGEIPRAFVVRKGETTADELMGYVAERVAPYKKVRRIDFVEAIPKSASGKILRRLLRDRPA